MIEREGRVSPAEGVDPGAPGRAHCATPLGWVVVYSRGGAVVEVRIQTQPPEGPGEGAGVARRACDALQRWLAGGPWPRAFPVAPQGTPFQQRVWRALMEIAPGERLTYGELARRLQTGPRAVGGACRANPIPLLIPCHRVVAAKGDGGFAGHRDGPWLAIKRWLLEHERSS